VLVSCFGLLRCFKPSDTGFSGQGRDLNSSNTPWPETRIADCRASSECPRVHCWLLRHPSHQRLIFTGITCSLPVRWTTFPTHLLTSCLPRLLVKLASCPSQDSFVTTLCPSWSRLYITRLRRLECTNWLAINNLHSLPAQVVPPDSLPNILDLANPSNVSTCSPIHSVVLGGNTILMVIVRQSIAAPY
jgi:hypothetical protein